MMLSEVCTRSATSADGSTTVRGRDPAASPEHLNRGSEGNCQLTVKADVSERLGSDTYCHVVTGNGGHNEHGTARCAQ